MANEAQLTILKEEKVRLHNSLKDVENKISHLEYLERIRYRSLIFPEVLKAMNKTEADLPTSVTEVAVCGGPFKDWGDMRENWKYSVALTYKAGGKDVNITIRDDTIYSNYKKFNFSKPEFAFAAIFWDMLGKNASTYDQLDKNVFRRGDPEYHGTRFPEPYNP